MEIESPPVDLTHDIKSSAELPPMRKAESSGRTRAQPPVRWRNTLGAAVIAAGAITLPLPAGASETTPPAIAAETFQPLSDSQLQFFISNPEKRPPLSASDQKIIDSIKKQSAENQDSHISHVFKTPNVTVEYNPALDILEVEISTTQQEALKDYLRWLKDQGLSSEGITNYPSEIYPNFDLLEKQKAGEK